MEWINKTGVKISKHSYLQRVHRKFFHYIKQDKSMQIDIDEDTISLVSIPLKPQWMPPHEKERIGNEERELIVHEIHKALKFMRIKHELMEE